MCRGYVKSKGLPDEPVTTSKFLTSYCHAGENPLHTIHLTAGGLTVGGDAMQHCSWYDYRHLGDDINLPSGDVLLCRQFGC
jgi:hypothetical protein